MDTIESRYINRSDSLSFLKRIRGPIVTFKEVEFLSYHGTAQQFELIKHFVEKDAAPENVIIDFRCFKLRSYQPWDCIPLPETEDGVHASSRATAEQQLKELLVPSRINVQIL